MEKRSFRLLLLIVTMFLVGIFILLLVDDLKIRNINRDDIHKVTDISTFYTVESCATKYVAYLMSKDYKAIYSLLDDNYINKNNITEKNVNKYVDTFDSNYGLKVESMYRYKDFNIYYIKGKLVEDVMDVTKPIEKSFKITIKLDEDNNKFSIIPDGDGGVLDDK